MTGFPGIVTNAGWVLATILAFGAMIFVHELGHFLVAKRAGVTIHTFALGFGPRVFAWRRGATDYALNLIPFGGYVKMAGEDFEETPPEEGSFRGKPLGARMAVVVAGPVMNLVFAAAILAVLAGTFGIPVGVSNRVRTLVTTCGQTATPAPCPATQAGLKAGDAIVAIDGTPTRTGEVVVETIHRSANRPLVLTVERDGRQFTVTVTPRLDRDQKIGLIGFVPEFVRQRYGPAAAVAQGVRRTGEITVTYVRLVGQIIRAGALLRNLGGPVAAGGELVRAGRRGVEDFLLVTASLSIIIGIFNLIPVPALDGGRLAFLLVEAVRRRPVNPRREGYIHLVGFVLLILLLIFLTAQDMQRLLQRRI